MENQDNNSEALSERDLEFRTFYRSLDVTNPSPEEQVQAKVYITEKPLYANMLMEKILMEAELVADLHSFGRIALMCMKIGIEKEQIQNYINDSFSGYWDEVKSQQSA